MPRANRYLLAGYTYHLTHRCRDRQFLLRFAKDRNAYREWLRIGAGRYEVPVYGYCVTSSHVHVVLHVDDTGAVGRMMQLAAGATARAYNRRKGRSGPFWEDQYHCTIVENGEHLWRCLRYVDLNMVRAGAVRHPSEWRWCGYHELTGRRCRYRILSPERLLESLGGMDMGQFRSSYVVGVEERCTGAYFGREAHWTESLAVGSRRFVEVAQSEYNRRYEFDISAVEQEGQTRTWTLREASAAYTPFSGSETKAKRAGGRA